MPTIVDLRRGRLQFFVILSLLILASFANAILKGMVSGNFGPPALTDTAILLMLLVVRGRLYQFVVAGYYFVSLAGGLLVLGYIVASGKMPEVSAKIGSGIYFSMQVATLFELIVNAACIVLLLNPRSSLVSYLNAIHAATRWLHVRPRPVDLEQNEQPIL